MRPITLLALRFSFATALTIPEDVQELQADIRAIKQYPNQQGQQAIRGFGSASINKKTWDPPAHLIAPLNMVWGNYTWEKTYKNWVFHQIYANDGNLNFCVKWDSTLNITRSERAQLNEELGIKMNKWVEVLAGYEGWKYPQIPVKITSWAAKDKDTLAGLDATAEGFTFAGTACNAQCYRFTHRNGQYPQCAGGAKNHHDMILTLNDRNRGGGSGQDFGQNLGAADIIRELKRPKTADRMHIFLHEAGHGFGLDDFYRPQNSNNKRKPERSGSQTRFLMKAGAAFMVTEYDAWMLRNMWTCNAGPQLKNTPVPSHCNIGPMNASKGGPPGGGASRLRGGQIGKGQADAAKGQIPTAKSGFTQIKAGTAAS